MVGSWDALIKSIKRSLESIKNGRTIYEEVLRTLLCEVESILNSWPFTSISDDITDFDALTPNHILLGSSQPNVEPSNYENPEVNYLKKWRAVQAYTNLLWKRRLSEYLPTLSPRTKLKICSRNLFFCRKKIEKFDTVNENFPWLESQKYERYNITYNAFYNVTTLLFYGIVTKFLLILFVLLWLLLMRTVLQAIFQEHVIIFLECAYSHWWPVIF